MSEQENQAESPQTDQPDRDLAALTCFAATPRVKLTKLLKVGDDLSMTWTP